MPHEDRSDRAARDGRREEELAIFQMKLDDVASQRDIPNRRDTLALRLHLADLVDHGLVALRSRVGSLRAGEGERMAEEQRRGYHEEHGRSQTDRPESDSGNVAWVGRFSEGGGGYPISTGSNSVGGCSSAPSGCR